MPKNQDVRIGAPFQKVTGAIKHAPLNTTLPTKATDTLDAAFTGDEYVSEDGMTMSPSRSMTDIKDWGGLTVRKLSESYDVTLAWTMISTNEGALKIAFGDENVDVEAATAAHGTQITAALNAYLPDRQAWVILMKDGDARMMIIVPDGQITEVGEITFASNAAIGWPVTLSCYPDEDGNCVYIITDDGVKTA